MINKLQRVQNQAARLVLRKRKRDHITAPMLITLHWLPIKTRIFYKIVTICYKYKNDSVPLYINELINDYIPPRQLRSTNKFLLSIPKKGSARFADRSFRQAAPAVWNSLPLSIRSKFELSEPAFKKTS